MRTSNASQSAIVRHMALHSRTVACTEVAVEAGVKETPSW